MYANVEGFKLKDLNIELISNVINRVRCLQELNTEKKGHPGKLTQPESPQGMAAEAMRAVQLVTASSCLDDYPSFVTQYAYLQCFDGEVLLCSNLS